MHKDIELVKTEEVAGVLQERGISDVDVKLTILHGEITGEKLHNPENDRFLTKTRYCGAVYYAEYSISDGRYVVHSAYSHRSEIKEGKTPLQDRLDFFSVETGEALPHAACQTQDSSRG